MFNIQAKFEDCNINAWSETGKEFKFNTEDTFNGVTSDTITVTPLQLSYILQMNLHNDGEPEGFEKMYESLEPLFKDWPNGLRPIP